MKKQTTTLTNQKLKKSSWSTTTTFVDIDTGEEIHKHEAKRNYIIKNKYKHVERAKYYTGGRISIIYECTRNPQRTLYE